MCRVVTQYSKCLTPRIRRKRKWAGPVILPVQLPGKFAEMGARWFESDAVRYVPLFVVMDAT